jgi:hypothetical protein
MRPAEVADALGAVDDRAAAVASIGSSTIERPESKRPMIPPRARRHLAAAVVDDERAVAGRAATPRRAPAGQAAKHEQDGKKRRIA